jgi:hypothetical protein
MSGDEFTGWRALYDLEAEELEEKLAEQRAEIEAARTGN